MLIRCGMGLGINVGKLIQARGLSYGDVARGAGIPDPQAIWNLVKRKSSKSSFAGQLADFFGVPVHRLLADDFEPDEVFTGKADAINIRAEELEALKRLRRALPAWRAYVLQLAMNDNRQAQGLLLRTMSAPVSDHRVEEFVPVAPHAAARRGRAFSSETRNKARPADAKKKARTA